MMTTLHKTRRNKTMANNNIDDINIVYLFEDGEPSITDEELLDFFYKAELETLCENQDDN